MVHMKLGIDLPNGFLEGFRKWFALFLFFGNFISDRTNAVILLLVNVLLVIYGSFSVAFTFCVQMYLFG